MADRQREREREREREEKGGKDISVIKENEILPFDRTEIDFRASQVALVVKNSLINAGGHKRLRFDPWVGKIPRRRQCNPLQYACLEKPMDRGDWQATVHSVAQSDTTSNLASMDELQGHYAK